MRVTRRVMACFAVLALVAGLAYAQEGHPLKGTWLGDWGPNKTTRNQVFIVMDWDGKAITGTINPGTDNIPLRNASLESASRREWVVRFEAEGKDTAGVRYVIEGKIENISLPNRTIVGTWTAGATKNEFRLVRQ